MSYRVVAGAPLRIGGPPAMRGDTWMGPSRGTPGQTSLRLLDRVAWHGGTVIGFSGGATAGLTDGKSGVAIAQSSRILTDEDCQLIYQRCSDVRSAINSVALRVATADWDVQPTCPPTDPEHEEALLECEAIRTWLEHPSPDDVWQEVWTAVVADAMKFPAGVVEMVTDGRGRGWTVDELVPVRGANFHPITDDKGRLVQYVQQPMISGQPGSPTNVVLDPDKVLYLRIAATTESREPVPLLEALVYEVMSILQGNETISKMLSSNEVPEGILVLVGLARDAAERARAQYEGKAGEPWRLRVLTSPDPGAVDAKWVEFRKTAKEMDTNELVRSIRRAVWRVFGVMPVEMGETDATPRATAEVQVDAGSSHLITPFLDLLETKINVEVLPRRTGRKDVRFAFKRSRDLTPAERVARADELTKYVAAGLLSRNQARQRMPDPADPFDGGDVITVESATVRPLARVLEEPQEPPAAGQGGPQEPGDDEGEGEGGGEQVDAPEAEEDDEAENDTAPEDENVAAGRKPPRGGRHPAALSAHRHTAACGPNCGHRARAGASRSRGETWAQRALRGDEIPPAWRASGPFKGARTLDLERLWEDVTGYQRDVLPLWEEARTAVIQAVAAHYKPSGFDAAARQRVEVEVYSEVTRLLTRWSLAVAPRYGRVAEDARARAGSWTGVTDGAPYVAARAESYRTRAMGYLTDTGGLLTDLRNRLVLILTAVTDVRSVVTDPTIRVSSSLGAEVVAVRRARRGVSLGPEASLAAVLSAVGGAFDALQHRIGNWATKLIDLASDVVNSEVIAGSGSGRSDGIEGSSAQAEGAVDWWCEWASVGDEASCETCLELGSAGYIRVADLRVFPGGGTQCRGNCRCVLCYWTADEIADGRAKFLGGGNTGRPL